MTKEEKIEFIRAVLKNAEEGLLAVVDEMPDEWDGIELRTYIPEYISNHFTVRMAVKRKTDYRNTILTSAYL